MGFWDPGSPFTSGGGGGGGTVTGSGTTNTVTKWTSSTAVGNSGITDDGSTIGLGENVSIAANKNITAVAGTGGATQQFVGKGGIYLGARTTVADVNKTTSINDHVIAYTSISAARTVTLTTTGTATGPYMLWIKDESGSASVTNTITGTPSSGNIDGAGSKVLVNLAFGAALVYCNGTNWFTLSTV